MVLLSLRIPPRLGMPPQISGLQVLDREAARRGLWHPVTRGWSPLYPKRVLCLSKIGGHDVPTSPGCCPGSVGVHSFIPALSIYGGLTREQNRVGSLQGRPSPWDCGVLSGGCLLPPSLFLLYSIPTSRARLRCLLLRFLVSSQKILLVPGSSGGPRRWRHLRKGQPHIIHVLLQTSEIS